MRRGFKRPDERGFKLHVSGLASHSCGDALGTLGLSGTGTEYDGGTIPIAPGMARHPPVFEREDHGLSIVAVWNRTIAPMRKFPSILLGQPAHVLRLRRGDARGQHQHGTDRDGEMKQGHSHRSVLLLVVSG